MRRNDNPLSVCRMAVGEEFYKVINFYRGSLVTEKTFRDCWLERIYNAYPCFRGGWYRPPENGCAVLFGNVQNPNRINFDSLRNPGSWPSSEILDWHDGYIYVYCSQVDRVTGEMADFSAFHYLGSNPEVLDHIIQCRAVHSKMLSMLKPGIISVEFHAMCYTILDSSDLYIAGHSETDPARINFGHSLISLSEERLNGANTLSDVDIENLSKSRRFINSTDNWSLQSTRCFSVEPRLRSCSNPMLPQVSLHSIASIQDQIVIYQNDFRGISPFED
jgi:hypothetical protein